MTTVKIHGNDYAFDIIPNPSEYGNYYVRVRNQFGFTAYLYPDLQVRGRLVGKNGLAGYFLTLSDADSAINSFINLYEDKPTMGHKIDATVRGMMDNALQDMIIQQRMFTAFDVTSSVRASNPNIHVFHDVVKEYVHDQYENGGLLARSGYDRTLVPIGNPNPWCYFIPGKHNPGQYGGTPNDNATPVPSVKAPRQQQRNTVRAVFKNITY